jgi:hypothetical protein
MTLRDSESRRRRAPTPLTLFWAMPRHPTPEPNTGGQATSATRKADNRRNLVNGVAPHRDPLPAPRDEADHRLLPAGEKVPEGRMRGPRPTPLTLFGRCWGVTGGTGGLPASVPLPVFLSPKHSEGRLQIGTGDHWARAPVTGGQSHQCHPERWIRREKRVNGDGPRPCRLRGARASFEPFPYTCNFIESRRRVAQQWRCAEL